MTGTTAPADKIAPVALAAAGEAVSVARKALALALKRAGIGDFTFEARILIEDLAGDGDPIDEAAATRLNDALARRLAGEATSWVRILTHPITGTVLDVDRRTYRVPTALRRWLGVRDPVCIGPGCTRPAPDCDIDHRLDWQYGGTTADTNLAPLCERHHVLKTKSAWKLYRDEITGVTWWVTPTARIVDPEPPPW